MSLPHSPSTTRRRFLQAAGALGLGGWTAARGFAADPPSEKIRLGFIGVGNQGTNNLKAFLGKKGAVVVAVCDVDSERLGKAKAAVEAKQGGRCSAFADYRSLLDSTEVDAVVITTPDHWHALPTIDACRAGKDVYCEKPLTLFIDEGKAMIAAARKHERIVQTGSQQRSDDRFRLAAELVRSGVLGKIKTVKIGLPGVNFSGPAVPDGTPPAVLDYETWLGPAPKKPYNEKHVHYNFRFFWDYSGGQQTNFGAHHYDIAQWALGRDASGPVSISGTATYHDKGWFEVPAKFEVVYRYDDGVEMIGGQGYPGGVTFVGEKGTLFVDRKKITADPAEILRVEPTVRLEASKDHHVNWLDCIRSRKTPIADIAIGHRSASVCHLGNIAIRAGRPIRWDPAAEAIVDDTEAQAMLARPYRAPWKLPTA
ncbi:MAG: Gfo/Idh/MocA family oxidoreductase [Isosphaeraceae bacterium]|nr:Gfo/Idh/MocA family oxidoreductase [Isosphaeraceae bacterium]